MNESMNNQTPMVNIISEGTKLKGNINSQNDIRVAGTIDGEAHSKGKLIVTSNGKIKGNVNSTDADIAGKVEGEVRVTNKLILRENAVIDGNIYTKSLVVEEGGEINGSCRMGTDVKKISDVPAPKTAEEKEKA
ncbi:polymer-forming cytoskeletal protein [Balneola sp. MJW-20]|uniref:bactofilin family protein n=1 Tax=Gracilimonas aurantiaca TaxID=3234185 RepID=UPI00390A5826